jgi:hypothetical protein
MIWVVFSQVSIPEMNELAFIEMWGKLHWNFFCKFPCVDFENSKAKIFKWQRWCIFLRWHDFLLIMYHMCFIHVNVFTTYEAWFTITAHWYIRSSLSLTILLFRIFLGPRSWAYAGMQTFTWSSLFWSCISWLWDYCNSRGCFYLRLYSDIYFVVLSSHYSNNLFLILFL